MYNFRKLKKSNVRRRSGTFVPFGMSGNSELATMCSYTISYYKVRVIIFLCNSAKIIFRQNPSAEFYNVADNLDSLLQPIDAPANIIAQVDSNGKIIGFVENERIIVGSANTSMSINRQLILNFIKNC